MINPDPRRPPLWVTLIIVIAAMPVLSLPAMLSATGPDTLPIVRTLLWGYPLYVILAGWLAWICYRRRPYMTWILIVLMILTHLAMWVLLNTPQI